MSTLRFCLIIVLTFLTLSPIGCGDDNGPLKIFIWEQMDPAEQKILDLHLAAWMAANPDVVVEHVHFETEALRTQFQNATLAGSGPELIYGPSDQVGPFSIMGIIEPLDGLFTSAELDSFNTESLILLARPGEETPRLWSLPDQVGNHLTLCYNKLFVPEPPEDFDQLITIAKRNTFDDNSDGKIDRYGLVFNQREPFWLVPFLGAYGGWVMDDQGRPTLDSSAMIQALTFMRDLKTVHGIIPVDCDYDIAEALFKEGKAAFIINGPWSWQGYRDGGVDLGLMPIPPLAGDRWPTPMVSSKGYSLNANSSGRARQEGLRLMRYLTGEAVQGKLAADLGVIPSRKLAGERAGETNAFIAPSLAQIEHGRAMPVVAEMRAIWDVTRPELQAVLGGGKSPTEAAVAMQAQAIKKIREMKGN